MGAVFLKMNVHQASRRINSGQHAANVRVQPPVYGHPVNMGVRQQAMHQVNQWQTHQAWQAQQHHQTQIIQKTFVEGGANRGGAAPPPQQRRAPSQAIPILDAPSSSEEEKAPQPKKSSALLIIDPDTMEEVKVEKVAPKPKQNKGKGGKGGPRLTGLANYEARKMQRQSSIGSKTVSSGPPARGAGAAPLNNDYSSPNHKEGSIEEKELHTSPALEIPPQVPQVPQVPMPPMPAPVQVQHREPFESLLQPYDDARAAGGANGTRVRSNAFNGSNAGAANADTPPSAVGHATSFATCLCSAKCNSAWQAARR